MLVFSICDVVLRTMPLSWTQVDGPQRRLCSNAWLGHTASEPWYGLSQRARRSLLIMGKVIYELVKTALLRSGDDVLLRGKATAGGFSRRRVHVG